MEYLNFKKLLLKQKFSELKEEYENQLIKKGRKNDDLDVVNDFIVDSVLSSLAVLKHNKHRKNALKIKVDL